MYEEKKTVWLGLISLLSSVVAWMMVLLITAVMVYCEVYLPGGIDAVGDESPVLILIGILFFISLPFGMIGLVLALVGLFKTSENKVFSAAGMLMSGTLLLLLTIVVALGITESWS